MTLNQQQIQMIMNHYAQGQFLMADNQGKISWCNTRTRTLIPLDHNFRYPRSLRRHLGTFTTSTNQAFDRVVHGCATRGDQVDPDPTETWLSPELIEIFLALHQAGWAHSFETWQGEALAGGILGIVIGGAFIGESMFYNIPNGSKVAMVKLVEHLRNRHFTLFDAQLPNPHLARFGAKTIPLQHYQRLLSVSLTQTCHFPLSPPTQHPS